MTASSGSGGSAVTAAGGALSTAAGGSTGSPAAGAAGDGVGGSTTTAAGGSASTASGGNMATGAGAPGTSGAGGSFGDAAGFDVLVLMDVSGSTCTNLAGDTGDCVLDEPSRLDLMTEAVSNFLNADESASMAFGLASFGADPIGSTSCDPEHYSVPLVEFGRVEDNAQALDAALAELESTGETPTGPALRGACGVARSWEDAHPERSTVLLLVTDGEPQAPASCPDLECCPTLSDAAQAAAECYSAPIPIPTYVLAVGSSLEALSEIAEAGGTTAYFVTAQEQFETELAQFRADAMAATQ